MNVIDFGPRACARIRSYLDSYINNELLVETNHEVLSHLETCAECAAALEERIRVKERLQATVRRERVPASLRQSIQANLRRRAEASAAWMRFPLAVAAGLMLVLTGWSVLRLRELRGVTPLESPQDMITSILKIGLGDHVHCAVYRSYPKQPPAFQEMTARMGPEYAGLVPIVSRQVQDHKVVLAHQCRFHGRHFVHMVLKRE